MFAKSCILGRMFTGWILKDRGR